MSFFCTRAELKAKTIFESGEINGKIKKILKEE
jgi:hypothetical protein